MRQPLQGKIRHVFFLYMLMSSLSLHLSIRIRSVKEILHAVDAVSLQVSLRLLFMTVLNQEMRVSSQARRKRGNMKKGNGKDV